MHSPLMGQSHPRWIQKAAGTSGDVDRARSCRALSVMTRIWDVALCAMGNLWKYLNRGMSLKDHLPVREIENGWEEGDTEVSRPVGRLRQ